nr:A211 [uncultured bacterium]
MLEERLKYLAAQFNALSPQICTVEVEQVERHVHKFVGTPCGER